MLNDGGVLIYRLLCVLFVGVWGEVSLQRAEAAAGAEPVVNVKSFGAVGDGKTDDTAAIQSALDSLKNGGTLFIPSGEYITTDTIRINQINTSIIGECCYTSRIRYLGTKFVNVIEINTDKYVTGVKIRDLGIYGGPYLKGKAKYCFYAKRFHRDCEITGCLMREGVGILRIDSGYYSHVHGNMLEHVTPSAADAGITHAQWLEVHGPESAPVYMRVMNACYLDKNVYNCIGGTSGDQRTRYAIWIEGTASSMDANCIENCRLQPTKARGDSTVQTLIRFDHWIGTVDNLYLEGITATESLFEAVSDKTQVSMRNGGFYNVTCRTMFHNCSSNAVIFENSYSYRMMAERLIRIDEKAPGRRVVLTNCSFIPGQRYTDESINGHKYNLYDSRQTPWPLGIADGDADYPENRRIFPKILNGFTVTPGSDPDGAYIQVTCGLFLNEAGNRVSLVRLAGGSSDVEEIDEGVKDTEVLVRVRPDEKEKYYRLFIGIAGQPYLRKYDTLPCEPTGNWIAQFHLGKDGQVAGLSWNVRLKLDGEYVSGLPLCRVMSAAVPKDGYWLKGDRIINASPSAAGAVEWICVKSGRAGVDAEFVGR